MSSMFMLFSIPKAPLFVLLSAVIYASVPDFLPMSSQSVLIYVPFEQLTSILALSVSNFKSSIPKICIFRAFLSTSMPSRASLYSLLPSWWAAEYIGGICSISPINSFIISSNSVQFIRLSLVFVTLPVESCVSVSAPKHIIHSYSFSAAIMYSTAFVAFPMQIGKTPSAIGSSVPVCPTFFVPRIRLTL